MLNMKHSILDIIPSENIRAKRLKHNEILMSNKSLNKEESKIMKFNEANIIKYLVGHYPIYGKEQQTFIPEYLEQYLKPKNLICCGNFRQSKNKKN
jgi:hypothetical protein